MVARGHYASPTLYSKWVMPWGGVWGPWGLWGPWVLMGSMGRGLGGQRVTDPNLPTRTHKNPQEPIRTHVKRIACPVIPSRAQQYAPPVLGLFGDYLQKKRKSGPFIPKFDFLFISLYLYLLSCRSACRSSLEYRGWHSGWKWSPQGLRKDEDRADMPNTDTLITLKTLQQ